MPATQGCLVRRAGGMEYRRRVHLPCGLPMCRLADHHTVPRGVAAAWQPADRCSSGQFVTSANLSLGLRSRHRGQVPLHLVSEPDERVRSRQKSVPFAATGSPEVFLVRLTGTPTFLLASIALARFILALAQIPRGRFVNRTTSLVSFAATCGISQCSTWSSGFRPYLPGLP